MNKTIQIALATMLLSGLVYDRPASARGFGGFHGGGGGGGMRLGGGGMGGGMRLGGGGLGGGSLAGAMRAGGYGEGLGGGGLSERAGAGGGRLSGLGSGVTGAPGSGLSGLSGGVRSGLGNGELAGLRSELGSAGLGGAGLGGAGSSGRLQALEGRLQGAAGGTNPLGNLAGDRRTGGGGGALSGKRPSDSQLSNFLGIPSDNGLHHLSGETQSKGSQAYDKMKAGDGPLANRISGETQSKGSQIYDKMREGDGPFSNNISGETQSKGSQIYDKMKQGDGPFNNFIPGETQSKGSQIYDKMRAGDGPFKNFIPGETQKPLSRLYDSVRAGNHPLRPWSPWRIHNNAIVIRRNFNNFFIFTPGWYRLYPAAWYPPVWYYGDPWLWAPWPTLAGWCGYPTQPMYYDYGNNVVYQNNSVLVNGTSVGTPTQYANQAQQLASSGSSADAADAKQWMSLGVFAVSEGEQQSANMVMQLAVDKQGIIRGNYTNTTTKDTQVIHGAVDKKTQRAAWTIGDKTSIVLDTGIYNLTKDQTPVLVHEADGETKQWLMVRLQKKDGDSSDAKAEK